MNPIRSSVSELGGKSRDCLLFANFNPPARGRFSRSPRPAWRFNDKLGDEGICTPANPALRARPTCSERLAGSVAATRQGTPLCSPVECGKLLSDVGVMRSCEP